VWCGVSIAGTQRYFRTVASKMGITIDMVDMRDTAHFRATMRPNTRMVWIETPTNPLLKVIDIAVVCEYVQSVDPSIVVVVDNTFMSPYFQVRIQMSSRFSNNISVFVASTRTGRDGCIALDHEIHKRTYGCGDGLRDDQRRKYRQALVVHTVGFVYWPA
jgi:hypothetical protein